MRAKLKLIAALAVGFSAAASTQTYQAPRHTQGPTPMLTVGGPGEIARRADGGVQIESGRSPTGELAEHRRLAQALGALQAQRAGTADAYVVVVALDSDPVFGREARAAGAVLSRRYGAAGRTIILAGSDGRAPSDLPRGTPTSLAIVFARIAELMDEREDVLVLYTTSHGAPFGLFYHDADNGYGAVSPTRMAGMLDGLGIRNRLLIISACYSGVFVPRLQSPTTAIVTAASADRSSFGCVAENDWTFFGDAMINRALRRPQPLATAFEQARTLVAGWEQQIQGQPSNPQISVGAQAQRWLAALEARLPPATEPVGRPALEGSRAALRR